MAKSVLKLDDLKVSNLPELQGWKDKQEKLVKDNPFVEIIDNKTYEQACKNRTALLKGRTELEKQEKLIASKLSTFRKDVKTETEKLVAITLPHEEKQQEAVKAWEKIKADQKAEEERLENLRIEGIKSKIDTFESDSYKIIQATTFEDIELSKTSLGALVDAEYDFEEFDILFEKAKARVQSSWDLKCGDLQEKENQRLENERLAKEAADAKAKSELQASRLNEILPYVAFGEPVDLTKLSELDKGEYESILLAKKCLFEAKEKEKERLAEAAAAKAKEEKDKIFEIRKSRLFELGYEVSSDGENIQHSKYKDLTCGIEEVYNYDLFDFEEFISGAKSSVEHSIEQENEANERELSKEEESKFDSLQPTEDIAGMNVVLKEEDVLEPESELKVDPLSGGVLEYDLPKAFKAETESLEKAIGTPDLSVAEEKNEKETLISFIESLDFHSPVPEIEDEFLSEFLVECIKAVDKTKKDLIEFLNNK